MAFFAVLTLVPSTVAVGSALALLRGIVGPGPVADAENGAVRVVRTLMGPDLSEKVIAPFIHAQLSQPKGGAAIGGLLAAWWLSSHLFMATSHAVDLACLYRFSPNVKQTWADCLPGACAGAVLWILAAAAFRFAVALGLHSSAGVAADDPTVAIIGQAVNAVVATVLWAYLASVAILVGGELNVELRAGRAPAAAAAPRVAGYRPY